MLCYLLLFLVRVFVVTATSKKCCPSKHPHIIMLTMDDAGWDDCSFHGSNQIMTPNIDSFCYNGVILHNYFTNPICSPSRVAYQTGLYPAMIGLGCGVLFAAQPQGLGLSYTTMPQRLKKLKYCTHHVGKWHLGHFQKEYTPTYRGFDSNMGFWTGHIDYYKLDALESNPDPLYNQTWLGFDFRRGLAVERSLIGKYTTHIFRDEAVRIIHDHDPCKPLYLQVSFSAPHAGNIQNPLQAPEEDINKFLHISNIKRRKYAGMMSALDDAIGCIIDALADKGLLKNSVVGLFTDNGGTDDLLEGNMGSNYPLKGMKNTNYNGGVRGIACIQSQLIKKQGWVNHNLFHTVDWLPTMMEAAGVNQKDLGAIDGRSHWRSLQNRSETPPRNEVLLNLDQVQNISALIYGDHKIIQGGSSEMNPKNGYYGEFSRQDQRNYDEDLVLNSKVAKALGKCGVMTKSKEDQRKLRSEVTVAPPKHNKNSSPCMPCVYDIKNDPCETNNIASKNPQLTMQLMDKLNQYREKAYCTYKNWAECANPKFYNDTWVNFGDYGCEA